LARRTLGRSLRDNSMTALATARLTNHPARVRWNLKSDEIDLRTLSIIRLSWLRIAQMFLEVLHTTF
jgi:hypothetical protein